MAELPGGGEYSRLTSRVTVGFRRGGRLDKIYSYGRSFHCGRNVCAKSNHGRQVCPLVTVCFPVATGVAIRDFDFFVPRSPVSVADRPKKTPTQ